MARASCQVTSLTLRSRSRVTGGNSFFYAADAYCSGRSASGRMWRFQQPGSLGRARLEQPLAPAARLGSGRAFRFERVEPEEEVVAGCSAGARAPTGAPPPSACRRIPTASISSIEAAIPLATPASGRAPSPSRPRKREVAPSIPMNIYKNADPGDQHERRVEPVDGRSASVRVCSAGARSPSKGETRSRLPPPLERLAELQVA